MGTGKTTVGERVAARLDRPFTDSDTWLEARTGETARAIETEAGDARLHELEAQHLLGALSIVPPPVIAAAASVVDDEACRARLADPAVTVVWLRASVATMAIRFGSAAHRPTYGPDATTMYEDQVARRGPLMAGLADLVLDVDTATPDTLAGWIVDYVGSNRQTSTSRTGS